MLPINIYFRAFRGFDFGDASATAVFNIAILAVPAAVYLWVAHVARLRSGASAGRAS